MIVPRQPVLEVGVRRTGQQPTIPSVLDGRAFVPTTSARAALVHALRALGVGDGDAVLVPTYHCQTMIAPVVHVGARPVFYGIGADGLPLVDAIAATAPTVKAMLAAHWFGLPLALDAVAAWCRARRIALVEDCAHAFFGAVGDAAVGRCGDLAVASLTKFFPVCEGGCLIADPALLARVRLARPDILTEARAIFDVIQPGYEHRRLGPFTAVAHAAFALKSRLGRVRRVDPPATDTGGAAISEQGTEAIDATACDRKPAAVVGWMVGREDVSRQIETRRSHYARLLSRFGGLRSGRPLRAALPAAAVPYVFPLVVEQPAAIYPRLRAAGVPVFCWDRPWPGTPQLPGDVGAHWSRHVLQLGCHQSIRRDELEWMADVVCDAVDGGAA